MCRGVDTQVHGKKVCHRRGAAFAAEDALSRPHKHTSRAHTSRLCSSLRSRRLSGALVQGMSPPRRSVRSGRCSTAPSNACVTAPYVSFLQFSALPASQRRAFAAKSCLKLILAAKDAASPRPYGHLRVAYHASVSSVLVNCWSNI